jgi:hypothetical protein
MRGREPAAGTDAGQKAAGGAAITVAAGAVLFGMCCVLPFALPAVALASAGGLLAWLGHAQRPLTAVAFVATAGAWIWIWRQSARARARPGASTVYLMGIATVFFLLVLLWPVIESHIVRTIVRQ